jgi:2',3'-cyclic-nucleotide 2'-phosphodiesterase (5'-nucleotidase family)
MKFLTGWVLIFAFVTAPCQAESASLLILHTNDIHDHVRAGYNGVGGIAYVAGYIQSMRETRDDVLVLDAGDVMEKGDLVAFIDKSEITYKTMALAGYDVAVPGNHDDAYGLDQLRKCATLMPDTKFVATNLRDADGSAPFEGSTILKINGIRIGVIGIARPDNDAGETEEDLGRQAQKEADALEDRVDLTVVVTHNGSRACRVFSSLAPKVDIFISGHSHEILRKPMVVDNTGALIVQAGDYAKYVGKLELTIDLDSKKIAEYNGALVEMDHETIPVNEQAATLVDRLESELCPEARTVISRTEESVSRIQIGKLGAAAFYALSHADVAFCHPSQIIRDTFPIGDVDVNAVFRTGGQRGFTIVRSKLSGRDIKRYITGLSQTDWGQTVSFGLDSGNKESLEDSKTYDVVMPLKEWDTRFVRLLERPTEGGLDEVSPGGKSFSYEIEPYTFTDAVVTYLTSAANQELSIEEVIANVAESPGAKLHILW